MALSGVYITDTDGNIGTVNNSVESVCGMVFDYSAHENFAFTKKDKVLELTSVADLETHGINSTVLGGIPAYHIEQFFGLRGGSGRLFVIFADCETSFSCIEQLQRSAHGLVYQVAVWTEKKLWSLSATPGDGDVYSVNIVGQLESVAENIASKMNAPLSILLYPNTTSVDLASGVDDTYATPQFNLIPSLVKNSTNRYVSVMLGESNEEGVLNMQAALTTKTPVGACGADLAMIANNSVPTCIGYVGGCNYKDYIPGIILIGAGTSAVPFENVPVTTLEDLDTKGYNFFMKYEGDETGVYRNFDHTCTDGDYRTIARNRTIGKVRRQVRAALLPKVNQTVLVDPSTGLMTVADQTIFVNAVSAVLSAMATAGEISGASTPVITQTASLLKTDQVFISFKVVPVGTAKAIYVSESLSLSNS